VSQAQEFVAVHQQRLLSALDWTVGGASAGRLEEAECTAALAYELCLHWKQWRFSYPRIAERFKSTMLRLTHAYTLVLLGHWASPVAPVTKKQKLLAKPLKLDEGQDGSGTPKLKRDKDKDKQEGEAGEGGGEDEGEDEGEGGEDKRKREALRPFTLRVEDEMLGVLRYALSFLRAVLPRVPLKHQAGEEIDPEVFMPMFAPNFHLRAPASGPMRLGPLFAGAAEPMDISASGSIAVQGPSGGIGTSGGGGGATSGAADRAAALFGDEGAGPSLGTLRGILQLCANCLRNCFSPSGSHAALLRHYAASSAAVASSITASPVPSTPGKSTSTSTSKRQGSAPPPALLYKLYRQIKTQHETLFYLMDVVLYLFISHIVIYLSPELSRKYISTIQRSSAASSSSSSNGGTPSRRQAGTFAFEQQQQRIASARQEEVDVGKLMRYRLRDEAGMELDAFLVRLVRDLGRLASDAPDEVRRPLTQKVELLKNAKYFLEQMLRERDREL
jgi:hypothetical protein